jgi:hypothetical protein
MEERMKTIEQKNDGYGRFCKNILNAAYEKDEMNKFKYSKLVIMILSYILHKWSSTFKGRRL